MHAETAFVEARPAAIAAVLSQWRQECSDFGVLVLLPESEQTAVP